MNRTYAILAATVIAIVAAYTLRPRSAQPTSTPPPAEATTVEPGPAPARSVQDLKAAAAERHRELAKSENPKPEDWIPELNMTYAQKAEIEAETWALDDALARPHRPPVSEPLPTEPLPDGMTHWIWRGPPRTIDIGGIDGGPKEMTFKAWEAGRRATDADVPALIEKSELSYKRLRSTFLDMPVPEKPGPALDMRKRVEELDARRRARVDHYIQALRDGFRPLIHPTK